MSSHHVINIDAREAAVSYTQGDQISNFGSPDNRTTKTSYILRTLEPVKMDGSKRRECLPGTRLDDIMSIVDWGSSPSCQQNVLWLYGLAGSGKSTLSTTIAQLFRERGSLGAFLFFDRDVTERSDPTTVIRTLAYQLGSFDRHIGSVISTILESTPGILLSPLHFQFQKLMVEPLSSAVDISRPIVLVLDAFDECGTVKERKDLLDILVEGSACLPSAIRLFFTSRSEPDINTALDSQPHIRLLELDITSDVNMADILLYFRVFTEQIRKANKNLRLHADWPGDNAVHLLAQRACGLFVWAATALGYIDGYYPQRRLDKLLKGQAPSTAESSLDDLYRTALESAGSWDDEDFSSDFRAILGVIIVAKTPLTSTSIDRLLRLPEDQPSLHIISRLGCVLSPRPTVRVLHPSFGDFLSNPVRCRSDKWFIDVASHHLRLAMLSIDFLDGVLERNICNLTLSERKVDACLPDDTTYACSFWVEHTCMVKYDNARLTEQLRAFLYRHFLHWLEAMSILKKSRDTVGLLDRLKIWSETYVQGLTAFVDDARRFAQIFATSIEEHPLLVYMTALPFSPVESIIYQTFHDNVSCPCIPSGFQESWSRLSLVILGHDDKVRSVAFSPDATRIVSGSEDRTVRVWDATSGAQVLPALRGHGWFVTSVAFSPDGKQIVSCSYDCTIRLWDAAKGTELLPIEGHDDYVLSASFSHDGRRITSGSEDKTVRVWDATLGTECIPSMHGHQGSVYCVTFSPDDTRIASCSQDKTLRVWDARSGHEALAPLRGHSSDIFAVAFSPDGSMLVSGSEDDTVCLWDATSGVEVNRFDGHQNSVNSVTFSPDGTRVVSCSDDQTIRVRDATLCTDLLPSLLGHESEVESVSFSSDGTRIVSSGSWDRTIRVWDATPPVLFNPLPKRHQNWISAIAFSPDGGSVVSGACNGYMCMWDAQSGQARRPPWRENDKQISSIAFSFDGTRFASASRDCNVRIWDADSIGDLILTIAGHTHNVNAVAFSPSGNLIGSASYDNTVRVWNSISGLPTLPPIRLPEDGIFGCSVRFSIDGSQIMCTILGRTCIWETASGTCISDIKHPISNGPPNGGIRISSLGWIVDETMQRTLCKLPPMFTKRSVTNAVSTGRSIALGAQSGEVFVIQFPSTVLTGSETRPSSSRDPSDIFSYGDNGA